MNNVKIVFGIGCILASIIILIIVFIIRGGLDE